MRTAAERPRLPLALAALLAATAVAAGALATAVPAAAARGPAGTASPAGTARDRAATRTYLRASYRFVHIARANLATDQRDTEAFVQHTLAECPQAAAGSPQNNESNEIGDEILGTMALVVYRPDDSAIEAFAHTVRDLRWGDRNLTRAVRAYAHKLEKLAVLPLANICADIRAWAASGFQTLPEGTVRFNALYSAAEIEAEEVPLRLLAPYEDARDASLQRATKRLEVPLADAEAEGVAYWTQLTKGLEVLI